MGSRSAHVILGAAARLRMLRSDGAIAFPGHGPLRNRPYVVSEPSQNPNPWRIIGGGGFSHSSFGDAISPGFRLDSVLVRENLGYATHSKHLLSPANVYTFLSDAQQNPWMGSADSAWAGSTGDASLLVSDTGIDLLSVPALEGYPESEILPRLYLVAPMSRALHLHRVRLDGKTIQFPCVGAAVAYAGYSKRAVVQGLTIFRPNLWELLPAVNSIVLPGIGYGAALSAAAVSVNQSGNATVLAEIILLDRDYDFYSTQIQVCSAVVKDARNGSEWLTCATMRVSDYWARQDGSRMYGASEMLTHSVPVATNGAASNAACTFLRLSLISAPIDNAATAGYNNVTTRFSQPPFIASRGASTGGNSAMALDYEQWDFAATCVREFCSLAIPASVEAGNNRPAGHATFGKPQYLRLQQPDIRGIGSAISMLPQREAIPNNAEKSYFHNIPSAQVADVRSADYSLVMLKGVSLLYAQAGGASEAATLVPVLPQSAQGAFRFAGRDITGTTVRFEPVSQSEEISFGRVQNPGPLPEFDSTPGTFATGYFFSTAQPDPDYSGEYWSAYDPGGGTGAGVTSYIHGVFDYRVVQLGVEVFVKMQNAGVPQNSRVRLYNFTLYLPPHAELSAFYAPAARGMHNRGYSASQVFTAGASWDEAGYIAGKIVDSMVVSRARRFPVAPVYGLPSGPYLGAAASPSAPPRDMFQQAAATLPAVCGIDYECEHNPIAGKECAAGLFWYRGAGPSHVVTVPYVGRGIKATVTQRTPYEPAGGFIAQFATADVAYEPLDVTAEFTVQLETEEVTVFVQWHASLQGLGAYVPKPANLQEGVDIDNQNGAVSPYHWVRTSRIGELSPVLVADLWFTAHGTASVDANVTFPEGLPPMQTQFEGKRQIFVNQQAANVPLDECRFFAEWSNMPEGSLSDITIYSNFPRPEMRLKTDGARLASKVPFYGGTFVFNRSQTAALLRGESVSPTRWLEFPEGDPRGDEPQLMAWHNSTYATIKPVFRLSVQ